MTSPSFRPQRGNSNERFTPLTAFTERGGGPPGRPAQAELAGDDVPL